LLPYVLIGVGIAVIVLVHLAAIEKMKRKNKVEVPATPSEIGETMDALGEFIKIAVKEENENISISKLLEVTGEFYGASRAYMFEVGEKNDLGSYRGEWCAEGVESHEFFFGDTENSEEKAQDFLKKMPAGSPFEVKGSKTRQMPDLSKMGENKMMMKNYNENGDFVLKSIDEVKFSNPLMYLALKAMNINSLLSTLVKTEEGVQAMIGVENPTKHLNSLEMIHAISSFVIFRINRDRNLIREYLIDGLTGVNSARYINFWKKNCVPEFPFTVIVCDCNYLKRFNDVYGHKSGDLLLSKTGDILKACTPKGSKIIRSGGDEFLILCDNMDEFAAKKVINSITETAGKNAINGLPVSLALGSHTCNQEDYDFETARAIADSKMYAEKASMKEKAFADNNKNSILINEERFNDVMSRMNVVTFYKDRDCKYRFLSYYDTLTLKEEYREQSGIGHTDLEIMKDQESARQYYEDDQRVLATGKGSFFITKTETPKGPMYFHTSKSAITDDNGTIIGIAGIITDVTSTKIDFPDNIIAD